jgi:hypothetical protein
VLVQSPLEVNVEQKTRVAAELIDAGGRGGGDDPSRSPYGGGREEVGGVSSSNASKVFAPTATEVHIPFPEEGIQPQAFDYFIDACGGREALNNMTTADVCWKYLLPLTAARHESYIDQQRREGPPLSVGKATVFISHAWSFEFLSLVDALWFDLFTNNQHLAPELPFEWWCGTFKPAISMIRETFTTRCWC